MEYRDIPVASMKDDEFQIGKYVDALCTYIRRCESPITIAIQGEWGSGKTSFMKVLEHELCFHEKLTRIERFDSIWLDTWELFLEDDYETAVHKLIINLIVQMEEHFECKVEDHKTEKRKEVVKEYVKNFIGTALSTVKLDGNFTESMLNRIFDERQNMTFQKRKREFENFLVNMVEEKENGVTNKAFLIFVDDLDRLPPGLAVSILEALKNLFDMKKCIFVLAVDYDVIACGIEQKYKGIMFKSRNIQQDFFDKLIQVPYLIPMQKYNIRHMVIQRLNFMGFFNQASDYSIYEDSLVEIVRLATNQNPRAMKRLMNMMQLLMVMESYKNRHPSFMVMELLLMAMQMSFPEVYRMISQNCKLDTWKQTIHIENKSREIPPYIKNQYQMDTEWKELIYLALSDNEILRHQYYRIAKLLEYFERFQMECQEAGESVEVVLGIVNVVNRENNSQYRVLYDGKEYDKSSQIQATQGETLINMIDFSQHKKVLDVGCGSGNTTIMMWKKNKKMNIDAFDIADSQIEVAKENYRKVLTPEDKSSHIGTIFFSVKDALLLDEKNEYDLIFSNATLHWIEEPEKMYHLLYNALTPGGKLAVHQGGFGTYEGLHQVARRAANQIGLGYKIKDWRFPAFYPKKEDMYRLLQMQGYDNIQIKSVFTDETKNPTIVENFANASLIYYKQAQLFDDEYNALKNEYLRICSREQIEIKAHRLYILADKI